MTRFQSSACAVHIVAIAVIAAAFAACGGGPLEPRAPGARPLDEELPGDTTQGPTLRTLNVNLGDGVLGSPPARSQRLVDTLTIAFDYQPAVGFENVLVQLDGKAVSTSGTINMVSDHDLAATADRRLPLRADELPLVGSVRELLTAADVLGAWAVHRAEVDSLYRTVGVREARERLAAVYSAALDPVADSAAMRVLAQTLGARTFGASAPPGGTLLAFVNGLSSWPTEPARVEGELRAMIAELGITGVLVGHFYNDTPTRSPAFTIARCMAQAGGGTLVSDPVRTLLTGAGFLRWPVLLGACVPLVDLDAGRQAILDLLRYAPPPADTAVMALAARIQQETAAGASIILVAHSQGSLLVQQALATLGAGPQTCVGVITLGAPSSAGWPTAGEEYGALVVAGDIALDLGLDTRPATDTDVAAAVRDLGLLARSFVADDVAALIERLYPHFIVESYLRGDASRAQLGSLIATQAATLQQRTACGGP